MRKSLLLLAVLGALGFALPAKAQTAAGEVYLGYVFNRTYINSGSLNATGTSVPFNFNGGQIQGQYNINDYLSFFGYFSGSVTAGKTIQELPGSGSATITTTAQYALNYGAGPRLYISRGRIAPFMEVGLGGIRVSQAPNGETGANGFEIAAGGGVDIVMTNRISIRPVEFDYVATKLPDGQRNVQSGFTYSGGVIIRFGSH